MQALLGLEGGLVTPTWPGFASSFGVHQVVAFQVSDIVWQDILLLAVMCAVAAQKDQGEGVFRQAGNDLVHPGGYPAPDERIGAFQQQGDVSFGRYAGFG